MSHVRAATLLLLLATTAVQAQAQDQTPAQVRAERAWARATPPRAEAAAVYLTLTSPAADQLTGITSPAAAAAGVHEMTMRGEVMQMREIASLALPAGQPVVLAPGGAHIMLTGLRAPLRPGQSVALHLTFAAAPPLDVAVPVRPIGAAPPPPIGP